MQKEPCHAESDAVDARDLLVRVLTLRKVARWADVSESAVSKWLARGSEAEPIPPAHVPAIARGAVADGLDFPVGLLWPAMSGWTASLLANPPAGTDAVAGSVAQ